MRRFLLAAGFAVAAMLTTGSTRLHACSCALPSPYCAAEWQADAVFVGKVAAIDNLTAPIGWGSRRVTLAVQEAFKGVDGTFVEVFTGSGGGDCGFAFSVGTAYLVYAYRHTATGRLSTGICSRTTVASHAPDLGSLRKNGRQLESPVTVQGRAMRNDFQTSRTPTVREPFAGARIRLMGQSGSWETRTGADGKYELRVPVGRYRLTVDAGEGFYGSPDDTAGREVRIVGPRACGPINIDIFSNGRIRGRLVDATGRGIPFLTVDLADRSRPAMQGLFVVARAMTDADGHLVFERIRPGEYELGLMSQRVILRSEAGLDVGFQANIDAGTIRLPDDVRVRQVMGAVVDEAGAPVSNAWVRASAPGANGSVSSEALRTDPQGRFLISVVTGTAIELVAEDKTATREHPVYRTGRSAAFDAASAPPSVTLVVK